MVAYAEKPRPAGFRHIPISNGLILSALRQFRSSLAASGHREESRKIAQRIRLADATPHLAWKASSPFTSDKIDMLILSFSINFMRM
jgi:hypothetical protein